jgi:hypothetical protein
MAVFDNENIRHYISLFHGRDDIYARRREKDGKSSYMPAYIGRIQRSEKAPVIFDYRDSKIDYFEKLFKQRNRYYRKLLKTI